MAKTKTPLFSLESRGTIGRVLTSQKRGSATLLRAKPTPYNPYSLPQAYQRWLYQDYAYLWTQQTAAVKSAYRSAGVRFHLTAFQYWMKYQLTNLPDIGALWHLDHISNGKTFDSSTHGNHATVYGASATTGVIDGALYFDGLNDYLDVGIKPILAPTKEISIIGNATFHKDGARQVLLHMGTFGASGYSIERRITNELRISYFGTLGSSYDSKAIYKDVPFSFGFTYKSGTGGYGYKDGIPGGLLPNVGDLKYTPVWPFEFGCYYFLPGYYWANMTLDHVIVYTRRLDHTEVKLHSERRYPS